MKTTIETVKEFLENELKQKHISEDDKETLNNVLYYIMNKKTSDFDEWRSFLGRVEEKKTRWENIVPIDGVSHSYRVYESEGMLSFGMDANCGIYSCWIFKVNIMIHSNRRFIFHSIHEDMDELLLNSFNEIEEIIEKFLSTEDFKEQLYKIKEHSS